MKAVRLEFNRLKFRLFGAVLEISNCRPFEVTAVAFVELGSPSMELSKAVGSRAGKRRRDDERIILSSVCFLNACSGDYDIPIRDLTESGLDTRSNLGEGSFNCVDASSPTLGWTICDGAYFFDGPI